MTLRLKLILFTFLSIAVTVTLSGIMGYRNSQIEIENLAKDLTRSKADLAYSLCTNHSKFKTMPSDELKDEIAAIKVAKYGYIFVVDNSEDHKGELIIHPSNVGLSLYDVPYMRKILDDIDKNNNMNGYNNFTHYRQHTNAKDRQSEVKIGHFKYFKPWRWVIVAAGYESDIFASSVEVRNNMIKVIITIGLIAILSVYLIIRQMFKPVKRLTDSTKEVAKGNWDIYLPSKSTDEIGILSESFNKMVKSLRENASMWQEFEVARQIQTRMLPEKYPEVEGIRISAKSIPAKEVGGDFYDFITLDPNRLGIMIGDVSGHGLSAAMVMTAAMSTLRFAAEGNDQTEQVLDLANIQLYKNLKKNMFVTLFYGIIDLQNQKIFYTNAGQPLPLICRNEQLKSIPHVEEGARFPLGVVNQCNYQQNSFDLRSGDTLIFYTDGILETMNNNNDSYDRDRFYSSVQTHIHLNINEMIERLVDDMDDYRSTADLNDDVTLVLVRIE